MAENTVQTITIDDIAYPIDQFSPAVQQAVAIFNTFQADLTKAQLDVIKNQSALQTVGSQISEAAKKELADKAAGSVAADGVGGIGGSGVVPNSGVGAGGTGGH